MSTAKKPTKRVAVSVRKGRGTANPPAPKIKPSSVIKNKPEQKITQREATTLERAYRQLVTRLKKVDDHYWVVKRNLVLKILGVMLTPEAEPVIAAGVACLGRQSRDLNTFTRLAQERQKILYALSKIEGDPLADINEEAEETEGGTDDIEFVLEDDEPESSLAELESDLDERDRTRAMARSEHMVPLRKK